jgi:hypothetical protein
MTDMLVQIIGALFGIAGVIVALWIIQEGSG